MCKSLSLQTREALGWFQQNGNLDSEDWIKILGHGRNSVKSETESNLEICSCLEIFNKAKFKKKIVYGLWWKTFHNLKIYSLW